MTATRNSSDFDTVQLGGWWLPADEDEFPGPRPRIVVQHGISVEQRWLDGWVSLMLLLMVFSKKNAISE